MRGDDEDEFKIDEEEKKLNLDKSDSFSKMLWSVSISDLDADWQLSWFESGPFANINKQNFATLSAISSSSSFQTPSPILGK